MRSTTTVPRTANDPRRGRTARRALIAALAAAVTAVSGVAVAAPAQAAGHRFARIIAVAASADYLVYRQKTATVAGLSITKGSTLYSRSRTGHRHLLKDFDPTLFPTLQGSMLTESVGPTRSTAPTTTRPSRRTSAGATFGPAPPA